MDKVNQGYRSSRSGCQMMHFERMPAVIEMGSPGSENDSLLLITPLKEWLRQQQLLEPDWAIKALREEIDGLKKDLRKERDAYATLSSRYDTLETKYTDLLGKSD